MSTLPVLFVSHGSPMLAIEDSPARHFLLNLGSMIKRPKTILVVSAHWESLENPSISFAKNPETIHDFSGFPRALYEIQYPAPGAPELAEKTVQLLEHTGFSVTRSSSRGLDHGAWVPLSLMYPQADIPIVQISLLHNAGPAKHYQLGLALQTLSTQDVLILASGSLTHNLHEIQGKTLDAQPPSWVVEFEIWIADAIKQDKTEALLDYRNRAPHAKRNHPTEEHLMPLFVALGAGKGKTSEHIHSSHTYGVLAMDAYALIKPTPYTLLH